MDIAECLPPSALEEIIKWTGVGVALAGAVLASPDGAKRLVRDIWRNLRGLVGHSPQRATVSVPTIRSYFAGEGSLNSEMMWGPESPLEHRIEILLGRLQNLKAELTEVTSELTDRLDLHSSKIAHLTAAIDDAKRSLHERIDTNEEKAASIDAYGLPVIGLGIFLSGVPQELASAPWLGVLLTIFSIGVTCFVLALGIRRGAWSGKPS